ncbi:cilia- and flagella-associated protein 69-like [Ptychodera flava]|uniref:cilia- and flagella-associated protein 69-like n=1 Tax=Ptychodera flava TaxID=63121 RepID=UPI00396A8FDB
MATELQTTRPAIPLVGHIITDEEMGIQQGTKLQAVNLGRTVKLLTDPHSANMYERHLHSMWKVIRHYKHGFLMKDLVQVFKILNVCVDRVNEHPEYIDPMCEILKICSLPFLKEKSSDETAYAQIAMESISQLGYLMRVPSDKVRSQICKSLISFYAKKASEKTIVGHKQTTEEYNRVVIERSDIAETLVKALALLEHDTDIKLEVMDVLQRLSSASAINCDKMLQAEAAGKICSRMLDPDPSGRLLFRSVEILWNLLDKGDRKEAAKQLNNADCISALRDGFSNHIMQGFSHYNRQMRNDLLVIATMVAEECPEAPFIETGFAKQLILFATFQEVKSHNALVKHLRIGTDHEDFELKKLLINIIVVLSKDPNIIPLISEGRVLLALFSFVRNNENISGAQEWSPAQFEELQLHAMAALSSLAPLCTDDYMTCQGSTRLLLLLEWCVSQDDFGGHGNAFHGKGGRGNKRAQMRYCLHILRSMVSLGDDSINQDLVDQGAINQIINILNNACQSPYEDDAIDLEIQCDMLFMVSALCEGDLHRKELFGGQGVDVVLQYLKTDPMKISSGLGHHRLMLATVDCIWCSVVGCYMNEDLFLEGEGMFLLLDLLEACPKNMHNLILGCILDMCENPKSIHHVMTWRGKEDRTAPSLFVEIWKKEEEAIGVKRGPHGTILDTSMPLMGVLQEEQGVISLPAHCPSQAIVDVSENMRAKIYALFCKIGFSELPGLSTEDQVTVTIIERYMDFKLGEVWREVISELEQERVRPITPDQEALETISRAFDEKVAVVAETQVELLEGQKQKDLDDEQEVYTEIRENHRQKEKSIRDWNDYIARVSNYEYLKDSKRRMDSSIENSRNQTRYREVELFHATDEPNLQTTTFQGRHITVASTPLELTGAPILNALTQDKDKGVTLKEQTTIIV